MGLPGYDEEDVDQWLTAVLPILAAAQRAAIALTDAFLAQSVSRQPLGVDSEAIIGSLRGGVSPEEVYRRPFVTVWTALKGGAPWEPAVQQGLLRATSTAQTDVQLAMRSTLREVGEIDPRISGYQRVPDGGACDLCLVASTQRYRTSQLMPIHNRCGCGVEVLTDPDAGRVINRDLYRELKAKGAIDKISRQRRESRFRERAGQNRERAQHWRDELAQETDPERRDRLSDRVERYESRARTQEREADLAAGREAAPAEVTAEVVEHGELGPVLVNAEHSFTGPADL